MLKYICKTLLSVMGWSLHIDDKYDVHYPRQVIVYPHTSAYDLILASLFKYAYPEYFSDTVMIARHVFFTNPVNRTIFKALGYSPVNNNKNIIPNLDKKSKVFTFDPVNANLKKGSAKTTPARI